jgi:hypothetical protein
MGFFSKWFSKKKGAAVHECPKKGDICIYVYRVDNEQAVSGVKVSISGTSSGQKPTDGNGYSEFPDRDPGPYEFKIALPKNLAHYKIEPYYQSLSLDAGGHATGDVGVYPTGKLNVQVYNDLNPPKLVTDAVTVSVSGPAIDGELTRSGTHLFPDLMCGNYEVKAKGPAGTYDPYEVTVRDVVVPDGGTGNARLVLKLLNDVTPTITPDEREIWFMEPPTEAEKTEATAQGGEPYTRESKPVHIRVTYTETRPEKPYTDAGTLQFAGADVEVFVDQGCKTPFALDGARSARINNSRLKSGLDLYVRGKAEGQLTATLTLDPPADPTIRARGPAQQILEVKPENVVTPKIELEYKVVLADPDLAKHQDAMKSDGTTKEEKILPDNVTYIEVSALARRGTPPYTKGGKLEVTSGADKVKVYTDMRRTKALDRPLTNAELFGARPFILYVESVKDKEGEFKLKLTLDPSGDPHIQVQTMKEVEMAVVKLDLKLHQHKDAIVDEEFDADKDTLDAYFTALKDKVIPDQEVMTDEKQVKPGRLLHVQKDGHHGRAKLLLKKLTGWPGGTDDYEVIVDQECDSGAISLWDKETEGTQKDLPFKIKVSELKKADVELWVEGTTTTKLWRDVVLGAGVDRADGGLAKEPKHNGDWARFTVVQVKEIKLDYTAPTDKPDAWDKAKKRFFINFKDDPDGRKVKFKVELTEKLKDVPIHFMLAPHKDNQKAANATYDLPATWKWKDIEEALKHKDRSAQKKLLHLSKKTDADGKSDLELTLSRFGGDIFEPGAYITQDPHLAKYVKDHADPVLSQRKPVVAEDTIQVWRKFWYQVTHAQGFTPPAIASTIAAFEKTFAVLELDNDVEFAPASAPAGTFYEEWQAKVSGGDKKVGIIGGHNSSHFYGLYTTNAKKPIKAHLIVCEHQWDPAGATPLQTFTLSKRESDELLLTGVSWNSALVNPPLTGPLQVGGNGSWKSEAPSGHPDYGRFGVLTNANFLITKTRSDLAGFKIKLPDSAPDPTVHPVKVTFTLNYAKFWGGESNGYQIIITYDGNAPTYHMCVSHEIGHSLHQTPIDGTHPAGVPDLPTFYTNDKGGQGEHCSFEATLVVDPDTTSGTRYHEGTCVMFHQLTNSCKQIFCKNCTPYVRVQDLAKLKAPS